MTTTREITAPAWIADEAQADLISYAEAFGGIWLITFPSDEEDEHFEPGQEQDEREAHEDAVARTYRTRYLVVRGDGSEIWTSTEGEARRLLGAENTLFG